MRALTPTSRTSHAWGLLVNTVYVIIVFPWQAAEELASHFETIVQFIDAALLDKGVVFVHCGAGISRCAVRRTGWWRRVGVGGRVVVCGVNVIFRSLVPDATGHRPRRLPT